MQKNFFAQYVNSNIDRYLPLINIEVWRETTILYSVPDHHGKFFSVKALFTGHSSAEKILFVHSSGPAKTLITELRN